MITVAVDDVAFVAADAVVRPATTTLDPTTPALRRLEQVGGPRFLEQLRLTKELAVGAAVVTGGGDLPVELVIHAIIRSTTEPVSAAGVALALRSALQRAMDWQLARVALPPLGTGAGNLSLEDAADVMVQVLAEADSAPYPQDVLIVVETEAEKQVFDACLRRLPQ